jgi:cell division transport system permease protein
MIRVAYLLREFLRNLRRHPGTAVASVLSLTLLFVLFDLFWVTAGSAARFYRDLLSDVRVEVFLDESWPDSSGASLTAHLLTVEGVVGAEFVSREAARERLTGLVGTDLLMGYDTTNPLPRSVILTVHEAVLTTEAMEQLITRLIAVEGADEVHYPRRWLEKAEATKSLILQIGLILGLVILAAALVSSANNIRLMTRARAIGFRQLTLLGAGRLFIALPFILEGFLISGLSAGLGWAAILYGRTRINFSQLEIVMPSGDDIALYCLAAALLGAVSGYLGLWRALKE